jgi:hypothetical protein
VSARSDLAAAIAALAGTAPVVAAPPRNAAPPLYAIAPGLPYLRPSPVVGCGDDWRFDVWCVVTREAVDALDAQDAMAAVVKAAAQGMPTGQWLGINRANVATEDLAGVPTLATIVEVRVTL